MNDTPITGFRYHGRDIQIEGHSRDDLIFRAIEGEGRFYETDLLEYMRAVLGRDNACVIDVGANIGNHSVFLGLFVSDLVVAVEANPEVATILERNLRTNSVRHVTCRLGVGAAVGSASLVLADAQRHNIGAAQLLLAPDGREAPIPVTTLDALAASIAGQLGDRSIAAIKIDVEGMEPDVLKGATGLIQRHRPELFIETIDRRKLREVTGILKPLGYLPVVAHAATPVWHFTRWRDLSLRRVLRIAAHLLRVRWERLARRLQRRLSQR